MRTEYELIMDAIRWGENNPNASQAEVAKEKKKLEICNRCPKKKECFSCGVHEWWIAKAHQPQPQPR